MKICKKDQEPTSLISFRNACPSATWEDMRNDALHGGMQAYSDIKTNQLSSQRSLCAYCEVYLDPRQKDWQRVEHFHPKADQSGGQNWALLWGNLWVVCMGGTKEALKGTNGNPASSEEPLKENLSCDAYKDAKLSQITHSGNSKFDIEGWILSPTEIVAFPNLFIFCSDGEIQPNAAICQNINIKGNKYSTTEELVLKTIEHLNLNCRRLKRYRAKRANQIDKRINKIKKQNPLKRMCDIRLQIARSLFPCNPSKSWPQFFTLIRNKLGDAAENHLQSINFCG